MPGPRPAAERPAAVSKPPLRRAARVARVVALAAGVVVAALLVAVAGGWLFLKTARGSEVVRRWLLAQANDRLAGAVSLDRLRFGGDRLTLTGLALRDPRGRLVARVETVDVRFAPLALLRRRVEIRALSILRPELWLVQSADGLNLTRAVAGHDLYQVRNVKPFWSRLGTMGGFAFAG
ncbi:MAG: hypothetical protein ABUS79_09410, partial [Pseudomonadota bacterium]